MQVLIFLMAIAFIYGAFVFVTVTLGIAAAFLVAILKGVVYYATGKHPNTQSSN